MIYTNKRGLLLEAVPQVRGNPNFKIFLILNNLSAETLIVNYSTNYYYSYFDKYQMLVISILKRYEK